MQKYILPLLLLVSSSLFAQNTRQHTDNTNAWVGYIGTHKFTKKWGLFIEGQYRRSEVVAAPMQAMARLGLNYHVTPDFFVSAGYFYAQSRPYGAFAAKSAFPENRIWQQAQFRSQHRRLELVNRFRLEQRYVNRPVADGADFKPGPAVFTNRTRVFNRLSVPFKGEKIAEKALYMTAWDEVFINFGKNVANNIFDQNRLFVGLGYRIPKWGRLEAGYMNQIILLGDGVRVENNHTLVVYMFGSIDLRKI